MSAIETEDMGSGQANTEEYKELHFFFWVRYNSIFARSPISWTDLPMLICILKGLKQPQSFIDRPSYWQIIHCYLPQNTFGVDDEEATKRDAIVFKPFNI